MLKPSRWSAVVKVTLLLPTKNVLSNGSALKVIKHVMYASKRFRTYPSHYYEFKMFRPLILEEVEHSRLRLLSIGK